MKSKEKFKSKKEEIKHIKNNKRGITLVALVVTIVVMLILAGVSITALLGDDGIIKKAQNAADLMNNAIQSEQNEIDVLLNELDDIIIGNGGGTGGDDTVEMPSGWNPSKVKAVKSEDNVVVPVPIGFTASTVAGEKSVATGFVIKQNETVAGGVNEFVWVPVEDPSEMFGTDSNGKSFGKLYNFGTSSSPKNPPEAINWTETGWTSALSRHEPDIVTSYDGNDATSDSSYFTSAISPTMTGSQFKTQLQNEFEDMRESVETYGGFYIGRYETGNLKQAKAVVQKNNTDIGSQNWYNMYMKCKTVAGGTEATSSMIWGCQWDATLRWFLKSDNLDVVEYVTDSTEKGNYSGSLLTNGTGSNDDYSVNNIYDMAGNVMDWTLEADYTDIRVSRRRLLPRFRFGQSSFLPWRQLSDHQRFRLSVAVPHFM